MGLDKQEEVAYIAYTGKAALVLKERKCPNAMTAHKLLYNSFPRKDGTFYHVPKRPLEKDYKLIVVDEISMLPKVMWDLLLSHGVYVIALGDPQQLPPVSAGQDNKVLDKPHIFLNEIMRQEENSEIIKLTLDIRNGEKLKPFDGKEVKIIDKEDYIAGMYDWADQIIVGKNATRRTINEIVRKRRWGKEEPLPVEGDKIICLKNDWDHMSGAGEFMVNGLLGTIHNIRVVNKNPFLGKEILADFLPEYYTLEEAKKSPLDLFFRNIHMDYKLFTTGEPSINEKNFGKIPAAFHPKQFDYGYCITCHKSQGSEYDKVLVFEEFLQGTDHTKWLYTAATRAKNKLVIVKQK